MQIINVRIYNATGRTITLVEGISWDGKFGPSPPREIKTGEVGVFTIANSRGTSGVIVYRIQNGVGISSDCMVAFQNPSWGQNKVITSIREQGYFQDSLAGIRNTLSEVGPFCEDATKPGSISIATITREDNATCAVTIGTRAKT